MLSGVPLMYAKSWPRAGAGVTARTAGLHAAPRHRVGVEGLML